MRHDGIGTGSIVTVKSVRGNLTEEAMDCQRAAGTKGVDTGSAGARSGPQRVEDGSYGRSIRSGAPIPDERLEADPAAELTVQEAEDDQAADL